MRWFMTAVVGVLGALQVSLPVAAATEAPAAQESLPIGLAVVVISGLVVFAYLLVRPSRITGRKD
jgi:hypothetical protein